MPIHDLGCTRCAYGESDVLVRVGEYPTCRRCGAPMTWRPARINTDVCGSEIYDPILNLTYRSSRDRDAKMKARGFQPAGDKEGGARNEDGYKESVFAYRGQGTRKTPAAPLRPKMPDRVKSA